jgi:hypothetical protein
MQRIKDRPDADLWQVTRTNRDESALRASRETRHELAAAAMRARRRFGVCRMAVGRPFFPADVQFLDEESSLCQLQSSLRGQMSVVPPAVGDDFPVFREARHHFVEIGERRAPGPCDVSEFERVARPRVQQDEVE